MYFAGSLERLRLRPKLRITVVCPAGMATVWILVSRLLAEFPQVEVAQVVSKTAYEQEPDSVVGDFIVSTVPLDGLPVRRAVARGQSAPPRGRCPPPHADAGGPGAALTHTIRLVTFVTTGG